MKKQLIILLCSMMLLGTGCGAGSSAENSAAESSAAADSATAEQSSVEMKESSEDGLTIRAAADVDTAYIPLLRKYFKAIEAEDYDTYLTVLYPPFKDAFSAFIESQEGDETLKDVFGEVCHRFDEDGYASWKLTTLEMENMPEEGIDIENFFDAYINAGYFDESLKKECLESTEDIQDIRFSLYALYEGDEEPVKVVDENEIIVLKTKDGAYLFG
ncbi:MAG: hypothetical protein MJ065_04690 [Oscillospiraceae bacterium]|nr:hypothetical protein [Oscillospiraceae bacterium]